MEERGFPHWQHSVGSLEPCNSLPRLNVIDLLANAPLQAPHSRTSTPRLRRLSTPHVSLAMLASSQRLLHHPSLMMDPTRSNPPSTSPLQLVSKGERILKTNEIKTRRIIHYRASDQHLFQDSLWRYLHQTNCSKQKLYLPNIDQAL